MLPRYSQTIGASYYPFRDGLEDPLDDVATLHQQLDLLSTVVRIEYPTNCNTVIALLEEAVSAFQSASSLSLQNLTILESKIKS